MASLFVVCEIKLSAPTKGKEIDYRDLTGRTTKHTIKSKIDIYKIMFNTFKIK
jgi:hypothetical protein